MAQGFKDLGPVDAWKTPKESWKTVTIPDEDPLGKAYVSIGLNSHTFEAGKTYTVPAQVADYILDRVKVYNRSCVRLLQPNADMKSIREVSVGSANAPESSIVDGANL
jgi:hypothetical protein